MSKIEELIKEMCPDGIVYKSIESLVSYKRGKGLSKNDKGTGDNPIILYGELYTTYGNYIDSIVSFAADEAVAKSLKIYKGDVLLPISSTTKEAQIGKASVLRCNEATLGGDAVAFTPKAEIMSEFLMYVLNSGIFEIDKMKCVKGVTIRHLDALKMMLIEIPVPPIEVQQKIVHILDKFKELEAELQTELDARKKQYEYYRMKLLTFDEDEEQVELGNIVPSKRGKRVVKSQLSTDKGYPVYQNSLIPLGYHSETNCKANTTFIICAGAAGEIGYSREDFWAADDCYYYECPSNLNNRYLFHVMMNQKKMLKDKVRKGSIPRISRDDVDSLVIPLPPLEKQIEIATKLDKWDTICNDSKLGLLAEIEACHKQYEYYRDKLLTFERKVV